MEKTFGLTEDQAEGERQILEWLYKPIESVDDCLFRLSGSAGTGKTTLISSIIKKLEFPFKNRTCVSAPTHKARKIITIKSGCGDSETVQSLLGLKPDVSLEAFDILEPMFAPIGNKKMNMYKLLIIDEASMVNSDLYKVIMEDSIRFKTKIIFVGDLKQLPPIEKQDNMGKKVFVEVLSKTLTEPKNLYNITQIVRQEHTNPLVDLLTVLTNDIDNNTNEYLEYMEKFPCKEEGEEGYRVLYSQQETQEVSLEVFNKGVQSDNKNYVRYIAWTNDSVKGYNHFIRKDFLKADKLLILNEALLSYSSMPTENGLDYTIVNSEDYFVNSIEDAIDSFGIKIWKTQLTETDSGRVTRVKIVVPEEDNYRLYLNEREHLLNTAKLKKGKAWRAFYGFRDSYCLLNDLTLNGQKADKKNIDYGYGITIHKS